MERMYRAKHGDYFQNVRHDILHYLPEGTRRVLEVGAGVGATLAEAKRSGLAQEVYGLDVMDMDRSATSPYLDGFEVLDIERSTPNLEPESFDVLICADVLEHLVDPWETLSRLSGYLKPGGTAIVSLPNIREYKSLFPVFFGDFKYRDNGVMDRTHLRFFAKKNMVELVEHAGFVVDQVKAVPMQRFRQIQNRLLVALTFGKAFDFLVEQYIIVGRKPA